MPAAEKFRGDGAGFVGEIYRDERKAAGAFFDVEYAADEDRFTFGERRDRLRNAPVAVRAR
jgi:hypothetical protein